MKPAAPLLLLCLLTGCVGLPTPVALDQPKPLKLEKVHTFASANAPWKFAFEAAGDVWLLNEDSLDKVSPAGQVRVSLPNDMITGFGVDSRGNCWVGTQANLLKKYGPDGRELWRKQYKFEDWTHLPITMRPDDSLWIQAEGLEKLSPEGESLAKVDTSALQDVFFREVIETPTGELWLIGAGLGKLSADGKPLGRFWPHFAIQAAVGDRDGHVWVSNQLQLPDGKGTAGPYTHEIMKVSPAGDIAITLKHDVGNFQLAVDRQNSLWVLHSPDYLDQVQTLEKYDAAGRFLGQVSLDTPVSGLAIDPSGFLWVGQYVSKVEPRGRVTKYAIE